MHRATLPICLASIALPAAVQAAPITFNATVGARSASATFDTSGTNLIVTLTNTATGDVGVPTDVLTAVFFDITGNPALTRVAGELAPGSFVQEDGQPNTTPSPIGGEYAYRGGGATLAHGAEQGLSAVGFGVFGPPDLFPGGDVGGQANPPDGLDFGLVPATDNPTTHNGGADRVLVNDSVVFTLGGLPGGFNPATSISNVTFQYGTGLNEPSVGGVPEPTTVALIGAATTGLLMRRRRRQTR